MGRTAKFLTPFSVVHRSTPCTLSDSFHPSISAIRPDAKILSSPLRQTFFFRPPFRAPKIVPIPSLFNHFYPPRRAHKKRKITPEKWQAFLGLCANFISVLIFCCHSRRESASALLFVIPAGNLLLFFGCHPRLESAFPVASSTPHRGPPLPCDERSSSLLHTTRCLSRFKSRIPSCSYQNINSNPNCSLQEN